MNLAESITSGIAIYSESNLEKSITRLPTLFDVELFNNGIRRIVLEKFIEKFRKGTQYVEIVSAVTEQELMKGTAVTEDYLEQKCVKFVPASGAATRMFKDLYTFLEDEKETDFTEHFFSHLEQFAFYEDLAEYIEANKIDKNTTEGRLKIADSVVKSKLDYGNLPKALLKVHASEEGVTTPIDEHILEGEHYLNEGSVHLHFTIGEEHEELFNQYVNQALKGKEHIEITYSFQKKVTNTVAVDMENQPFYLENGEVFYRPGGHGALLENLNDLDADIVFIKNIDNVCHKSQVEATIQSKKELASIGLEVKTQIKGYISDLLSEEYNLEEIGLFTKEVLNITLKAELTKDKALALLDRPLRVCGMVKNSGEPGGGPFVVDNGDYLDLQICEKAEINLADEEKQEIFNSSKYFNPVDIVCFVKDYKGEKFDLRDYSNKDRYFISEKTHQGKEIKALEHPGLWNGAMHNWNTLFVEVPAETFNPMKTINDLLREGHYDTLAVK
ncbi:protein of unknown function [Desemzia incerta]|uniref:DUF4301 domain-containing protein n=1 Tax=Desemzia incerta TaxID=82801 RepID=A0A1I5X5E5_9LACT|nr:DUF4301 family protein [Desemzia incerta]SFQ27091.1 protein of unknown function [Desemzia incerta]